MPKEVYNDKGRRRRRMLPWARPRPERTSCPDLLAWRMMALERIEASCSSFWIWKTGLHLRVRVGSRVLDTAIACLLLFRAWQNNDVVTQFDKQQTASGDCGGAGPSTLRWVNNQDGRLGVVKETRDMAEESS